MRRAAGCFTPDPFPTPRLSPPAVGAGTPGWPRRDARLGRRRSGLSTATGAWWSPGCPRGLGGMRRPRRRWAPRGLTREHVVVLVHAVQPQPLVQSVQLVGAQHLALPVGVAWGTAERSGPAGRPSRPPARTGPAARSPPRGPRRGLGRPPRRLTAADGTPGADPVCGCHCGRQGPRPPPASSGVSPVR